MNRLARIPLELILWSAAIVLLATADTGAGIHDHHFTLCPLANMGFSWCPGCGLGRSITQLLQGNIRQSFQYHWLGIPALLLIMNRIFVLGRKFFKQEINKKSKGESYV